MTLNISLDASGLASGFAEASAEIDRLAREEIAPAAALVEDAFAAAAFSIERSLGRAARNGELSLKSLVQTLARDLSRVAIDGLVRRPIEGFLSNLFGGARAEGGPVAAGRSYLVGERGPELFTPGVAGAIGPRAARAMSVTINLPGVQNPESFRASETQIAASLSRVLARGGRNQ